VSLDELTDPISATSDDLLDLDDALNRLAAAYPQVAELVKLRFFGGLPLLEASQMLGLPARTADRQWSFARAWLARILSSD
jgi:DNA-directed RNA polymerase specialized sigma24 family protein